MIRALGLDRIEETLPPGILLLPLGAMVGPYGLNLLSTSILSTLDPAVSAGLATIGIFVGLSLNLRTPRLSASAVVTVATMLLVGTGTLIAMELWLGPDPRHWIVAFLLGLCASADDRPLRPGLHVDDPGVVLPIVLVGVLLAWVRAPFPASAALLTAAFTVIALTIALAGWLLVGQTSVESEQHVFVTGAVLLLGGAAAYLSLSALFAGLLAGIFWNVAGGESRDRIERDIRYFQHPLLLLLLIVAGAGLTLSPALFGLGVVYLVARTLAQSGHGWRVAGDPSGIVGVALALNVVQAWGAQPEHASAVLAVVAAGAIGSEMLAVLARAPKERA